MKKAIISFTHTNYCIRSAGTEKFVRSISRILQHQEYTHLNFFSFYDTNNRMKTKLIGINYNDKFQGVYEYSKIFDIVCWFGKEYNLEFKTIQLQHLLNHELGMIVELIRKLNIPVNIYVHDYYLICNNLKLINTDSMFCGVTRPSMEKCGGCGFCNSGLKHSQMIDDFLDKIQPWIYKIVTPSNYVTEKVINAFPLYAEKIVTRPHLILDGQFTRKKENTKIRVAFVGGQYKEKGYDFWEKLIDVISKNNFNQYEFFYFGIGNKRKNNVKNVFVSNAIQGDNAMADAIREYNIDCALLWSLLPETYSFVYYELLTNGVFCLTNLNSGNITDEVKSRKNGLIFVTENECIEWFKNYDKVCKDLYIHTNNKSLPTRYFNNERLDYLVTNNKGFYCNKSHKVVKERLMTLIYKVKYKRYYIQTAGDMNK